MNGLAALRAAGERLVLALWVGGMSAVGFLAAPTLFSLLDDRALAGELAGALFHKINIAGLVGGTLLAIGTLGRSRWRSVVLVAMLFITAALEFGLAPAMAASRDAVRFQMLHMLSSAFFVVNVGLGILLIVVPAPK